MSEDCEICGAMTEPESCDYCNGEGGFHDCGEDCCCCADPEEITENCPECDGDGFWMRCVALPHTDAQMAAWRDRDKVRLGNDVTH